MIIIILFLENKQPKSDQETEGDSKNTHEESRGFKNFEKEHDQYKQLMEKFKNNENDPLDQKGNNDYFNLEDKPIRPAGKNLEEIQQNNCNNREESNSKARKKPSIHKKFLKRSEKSSLPKKTKKYNYYASKFDQSKEDSINKKEKPKFQNRSSSMILQDPIVKVESPQKDESYNSVEEFEKFEEE